MRTSTNLKFQIPELDDQANITVIGSALDALDNAVGDSLAMSGDASNAQVTFERATARENISSKDTLTTLMSKVSRWLADLKDAAFHSVANNLTTTASGYVLDARQGKALNDAIGKGTTQLGGLYFGQDSSGKWGYKTSANGTVNPFRNPTGTANAGDVLVGKTFANASSDSINGMMPNNGDVSKTLTPTDGGDVTATIPAGYTSGGTITAKGGTAYAAGRVDAAIGLGAVTTKDKLTSEYNDAWAYEFYAPSDGYYLTVALIADNSGTDSATWTTTGSLVGHFDKVRTYESHTGAVSTDQFSYIHYLRAGQMIKMQTELRYSEAEVYVDTARLTVS